MESTRQQKMSRLIQKELGNLFIKEGNAIYGRVMVSVTVVRMSPDLSVAKVYLSIFGTEDKKKVVESLDEAKGRIRYMLGQQAKGQMRTIPELIFYIDDSVDYFMNIDTILKDLDSPKPEDDQGNSAPD